MLFIIFQPRFFRFCFLPFKLRFRFFQLCLSLFGLLLFRLQLLLEQLKFVLFFVKPRETFVKLFYLRVISAQPVRKIELLSRKRVFLRHKFQLLLIVDCLSRSKILLLLAERGRFVLQLFAETK